MSCSNGAKKVPNKVLIHIVIGLLYVPIFHYLGFLKILHGTGEDLVYQIGVCAVLVTAQMQGFLHCQQRFFCRSNSRSYSQAESHQYS